jgi:cell division protein FtsL
MNMKRISSLVASYKAGFWSAVVIAVLLAILLLTSCKHTEYVTIEKIRNDTTYITKHQRDSIWLHDSVMVSEKGDTVRIEKWHTKYIEKQVHDTIYVATHDTIPQPYPLTEYIEKPLSKIEKALIFTGIISLMALVLFIGIKLKTFLP